MTNHLQVKIRSLRCTFTRLIRSLREALDLTTIIVSHDVAETLSIADYIYVVAEGKIQGEGSPEQLQAHASPFVHQF